MSTHTTNYNFVKPDYSDTADIGDINGNFDIADDAIKQNATNIATNASDIDSLESSVTAINSTLASHASSITSLSNNKQNNLSKGTVAQNTNLNTITAAGNYWLNTTYGNLPHSGSAAGVLEVIVPTSNVIVQRYVRFAGNQYAVYNIFYRVNVSGTWYPWKTALVIN